MDKKDIAYFTIGILVGSIFTYVLLLGFMVGFFEGVAGIIQNVNVTVQVNSSKIIETMQQINASRGGA